MTEPLRDERRPSSVGWSVLYVAGWGRSGSTLLTALLDQFDGAFGAGEVHSLWARGVVEGRRCGCGRPVTDCPVWGAVLGRLGGDGPTAAEIAELQRSRLRTRHFPRTILAARRGRLDPAMRRYLETYRDALRAIVDETGCRVVVDSSKSPLEAYLLTTVGVPLRVLHLVRDPRSVAASWAAPKDLLDSDDGARLKRFSPLASSAIWTMWNGLTHRLVRPAVGDGDFRVLRHEDLLDDPEGTVRDIAGWAGLDPDAELGLRGHHADLGPNHLVAGNSDRFATGSVVVGHGQRERPPLGPAAALAATVAALPELRRYGYPLRAPGSAGPPAPPELGEAPPPPA